LLGDAAELAVLLVGRLLASFDLLLFGDRYALRAE